MTNAIEIKDLSKSYKDFTLGKINLSLPQGSVMGLIGENGAGKTTLIRLILDMTERGSGQVTILGRDNKDNFVLTKEDIGVVLDESGIPAALSASDMGRVMKLTYKNWDSEKYNNLLNRFSVPPKKPFRTLSKGTKMKLALAIALSHEPKLLILDEPASGLDPVARDDILNILNDFTRNETHSVLISSHIISDLEKICDYIAFLHKGKLLLCEEKDVLKDEYVLVHGKESDFAEISPDKLLGKKTSPYGCEAVMRKRDVPHHINFGVLDIEQLFVFMAKEDK